MIKFIEKSPHWDSNPDGEEYLVFPLYMLKDGKELFVTNRIIPSIPSTDDILSRKAQDAYKIQLILSDGKYFAYYGLHKNPIDMLVAMATCHHHFSNEDISEDFISEDLFPNTGDDEYIDFAGITETEKNPKPFYYRIYDKKTNDTLKKAVEMIKSEKWDEALKFLESEKLK